MKWRNKSINDFRHFQIARPFAIFRHMVHLRASVTWCRNLSVNCPGSGSGRTLPVRTVRKRSFCLNRRIARSNAAMPDEFAALNFGDAAQCRQRCRSHSNETCRLRGWIDATRGPRALVGSPNSRQAVVSLFKDLVFRHLRRLQQSTYCGIRPQKISSDQSYDRSGIYWTFDR